MPTPIITDGSTDRVPDAPRVVAPEAAVFADRAARFAQLAAGHPMADYLRLMAQLAEAQHAALGRRDAEPVPADALAHARDHGMPPLSALTHPRSAQWRADLDDLLGAFGGLPAAAIVRSLPEGDREALADRVLAGTTLDADAAAVPFVGGALQVYFTRLARSLDFAALKQFDVATVCPACATRPVASVVRIGGARNNLRYLVCALCSTEWNMTRIQCTACETDKGVHYLSLAEDPDSDKATEAVVKAEACDECKTYLKIVNQDKNPFADPCADDLATLALDLLVDEQGYARSGPNFLLHPGSG